MSSLQTPEAPPAGQKNTWLDLRASIIEHVQLAVTELHHIECNWIEIEFNAYC